MPVYNAEQYLSEAIVSILTQTLDDFELIIVDDGSTDSSSAIASSFIDNRIILLKNEKNQGISYTLNRGILQASGQYIARMDSDDISHPCRLERQFNYLTRNPQVKLVGSCIEKFGAEESVSYSCSEEKIKMEMLFNCAICHPSVMGYSSVFKENPYNPDKDGIEDYDLWWRLLCNNQTIKIMKDVLLKYRVHKDQITKNYKYDYILKFKKFKMDQLGYFGITDIRKGFEEFCSYSLNIPIDNLKDLMLLDQFLFMIYQQNKLINYTSSRMMRYTFERIISSFTKFRYDHIKNAYFFNSIYFTAGKLKQLL